MPDVKVEQLIKKAPTWFRKKYSKKSQGVGNGRLINQSLRMQNFRTNLPTDSNIPYNPVS